MALGVFPFSRPPFEAAGRDVGYYFPPFPAKGSFTETLEFSQMQYSQSPLFQG